MKCAVMRSFCYVHTADHMLYPCHHYYENTDVPKIWLYEKWEKVIFPNSWPTEYRIEWNRSLVVQPVIISVIYWYPIKARYLICLYSRINNPTVLPNRYSLFTSITDENKIVMTSHDSQAFLWYQVSLDCNQSSSDIF